MTNPDSNLMRALGQGTFVFTAEVEPVFTTDSGGLLREVAEMRDHVTALNVTDGPGATLAINSLYASSVIQQAGAEVIFQVTCRDMNRIALASSLVSAAAAGIKNVLVLAGDYPTLGNVPSSRAVFVLDSLGLLRLVQVLNRVQSAFGVPLAPNSPPFAMNVGIAANPNTDNPDAEILKIKRKLTLGADFIQTQVIFDLEKSEPFLRELKSVGIPVLVGLFPMKNYQTAKGFDEFVPGVSVPPALLAEFKAIADRGCGKQEKRAAYDEANAAFLKPMISELQQKGYAAGAHITSVNYPSIIKKLVV
jgi:methylenetetrahydrofolate reductase (NADPH)